VKKDQKKNEQRTALAARRRLVRRHMIAGLYSPTRIAEKINESGEIAEVTNKGTVSRDIRAIEKEWAEEVDPDDIERWRTRELRTCAEMEAAIAPESVSRKVKIGDEEISISLSDRIDAQRARLRIMDKRDRIVGVNREAGEAVLVDLAEVVRRAEREAAKE